jgi:hypothetical protein
VAVMRRPVEETGNLFMMILGIVQRQKNDLSWLFPHYSVRFCAISRTHFSHEMSTSLISVPCLFVFFIRFRFRFRFCGLLRFWLRSETVGDVGGLPGRFAARSRQPALHGRL